MIYEIHMTIIYVCICSFNYFIIFISQNCYSYLCKLEKVREKKYQNSWKDIFDKFQKLVYNHNGIYILWTNLFTSTKKQQHEDILP